jgi:hypothetical protein
MHWSTYNRLADEFVAIEDRMDLAFFDRINRLAARVGIG